MGYMCKKVTKADGDYAGLIGGGYGEDGVTGYINPLMTDQHYHNP